VEIGSVIKPQPGDQDDDGKFTVNDLFRLSINYGKTSSSPDWNAEAIKADFNKDGKVDLKDLVAVAMRILQK
jgi:hypothetical protein